MAIPSNKNITMIENTSFEFFISGPLLSLNFKTLTALIQLSCASQVLMPYYILTLTNTRDSELVFGAGLFLQSPLFEAGAGQGPVVTAGHQSSLTATALPPALALQIFWSICFSRVYSSIKVGLRTTCLN